MPTRAGLEACVQHGYVATADGLHAFARHSLEQVASSSLPLVTAAHGHPEDFAELDALTDVFLSNAVANRASRAQGRALLTSAARSFDRPSIDAVEALARAGQVGAHYAPTFGAVFSALEVPTATTQHAFLYIALRGLASAAVRLGVIGAYDAQTLLASMAGDIDVVVTHYGSLGPHEIAQTAPLIDLVHATHDRLYSRLFQS